MPVGCRRAAESTPEYDEGEVVQERGIVPMFLQYLKDAIDNDGRSFCSMRHDRLQHWLLTQPYSVDVPGVR